MEPLPRLPGLYFEAPPQPVASVLPRMDIAAFVGLAASGPLDLPVEVEDAGRFRDVFGPAPALAWDGERGRVRRAHLGSTVESFFANGGRRCWVVRVAGPGTLRHGFPLPGLESSAGEPAVARARAVGSWCEGLTVGTALTRDPLPLLRRGEEHPVRFEAVGSPGRPSYRLDLVLPATGLVAGDLLEVTFGLDQPRLWLTVGESQPISGGLRVWAGPASGSDSGGFWLEPVAASPSSSPPTSPPVCEDPEDEEPVLASLGETEGFDFARAWLGSPQDPDRLPSVRRLSFELLIWRGTERIRRLGDLGFDRRHPRYWAALLTDEELFTGEDLFTGEIDSRDPYRGLRVETGAPRFPLASPAALSDLYLPRCMGRRRDPERSRGPEGSLPGTPLERDGLDDFGAELFLDPRLAGLGRGSLLAEAKHLGLVRKLPLTGLHSLLTVEEATLVSVPDAIHRGWSRQAPPVRDLLGAPHLDPLPEPDRAGRYPLTWSEVDEASSYQLQRDEDPTFPHPVSEETEDPEAAVTLPPGCEGPVWFRVRARRHGETGPWSNTRGATLPEPEFDDCEKVVLGGFELRLDQASPASPTEAFLVWEPEDPANPPAESFELQESSNAAFEGARFLHSGPLPGPEMEFELPERRDGVRYYRVRGLVEGQPPWPWSNTVIVPAKLRAAWVETVSEEFDDGQLLAVHRALLRFCAARADLVALLSLPDHYREEDARTHVGRLTPGGDDDGSFTGSGAARVPPLTRGETPVLGFGGLFHPWLTVREEAGGRESEILAATPERPAMSSPGRPNPRQADAPTLVTLPPDGAAAGLLARLALDRGAWIAPANRPFAGTLAVNPAFGLESWGRLTAARINVLTRNPRGFLTLGAETLSEDDSLRPIHVRRLLILLRKVALEEGRRFVFQNNSPGFRDLVRHRFERVLGDLYRRGAFAGDTEPAAFRVTVDDSINPPESVDRGLLIVELAVAPARELAFITVRLLAGDGRLIVEEG